MAVKYSGTMIEKVITGKDGKTRLYRAAKLGSRTVALEGFKLIKAIMPSIGAAADSIMAKSENIDLFGDGNSHTLSATFTMLSENLSDEHMEHLLDILFGKLYIGDKAITDFDEHFEDHAGDFLELFVWLFKENFANFILESDMLASLIGKTMDLLSLKMKESLDKVLKSLKEVEQDSAERL